MFDVGTEAFEEVHPASKVSALIAISRRFITDKPLVDRFPQSQGLVSAIAFA
jgi:hypothetical protein